MLSLALADCFQKAAFVLHRKSGCFGQIHIFLALFHPCKSNIGASVDYQWFPRLSIPNCEIIIFPLEWNHGKKKRIILSEASGRRSASVLVNSLYGAFRYRLLSLLGMERTPLAISTRPWKLRPLPYLFVLLCSMAVEFILLTHLWFITAQAFLHF